MMKVVIYILTLIIVIWGGVFMIIGAAIAGVGVFYTPVIIIGGISFLILTFHQMYNLVAPRKMRILWISFFSLLLVSCGVYEYNRYTPPREGRSSVLMQKLDSCTIDSLSLYLYEINKKSIIMIKQNNELYFADTLSLMPPCRFLRDSNKIQSHSYLHINVNHVIFVVGDKRLPIEKYSAMQGIIFKKDSVIISQRKIVDIEISDNQWIDGKNFLDVAYYP